MIQIQYAMNVIQDCRATGVNTPFLRQVISSPTSPKDVDPGASLTNSQIAEECMGGMYESSGTLYSKFVLLTLLS